MHTNTKLFRYVCFPILVLILFPFSSKAQKKESPGEVYERKFAWWSLTLEQARVQAGATQQEYSVFNRFEKKAIDSLHLEFEHRVNNSASINDIKEYAQKKLKPFLLNLFADFHKIEQEFPSSVDEYRNPPKFRPGGDSCFPSCYNTDFEEGTLDGWYAYYAVNSSTTKAFDITSITGRYCGPVTNAGGPDPNTNNSYQVHITSGSLTDAFLQSYSTYSMPQVSPWGGLHSVMLGDSDNHLPFEPGQGTAILSQSFEVSPTTSSLTYQYAVFLENPNHTYYQQPFFSVAILDSSGDTIPTCGEYQVDATNAHANHFVSIYYPLEGDTVYWKNWTIVNVPLKKYIGQCITIVFQSQDCALGGHFGYAYVDASCSPLQLISSSPNFCGQDSISLTAPPGATSYKWKGPAGSIKGSDSNQVVYIHDSGVYYVVTVPVTGATCADTIYDTIGKLPGPFPHPAFTADSVCVGQPITFINNSKPDSGQFSWDFYNIGIYNYSAIPYKDTTWTYASAGNYTVKLHQLANGCGLDTTITVGVYNPPVTSVSPQRDTVCAGQPAVLTGKGIGVYKWSTGATTSSITVNPTKTTRYRLRDSIKGGPCLDTASALVVVRTPVSATISHDTSVCPNQPVVISVKASGEPSTYKWSTNATTSSITVSPSVTTTYTAVVSGIYCDHDTVTNTVTVVPLPAPVILGKDWRCHGTKDTLYVTSPTNPTTYLWYNGKKDTFIVTGAINADSTFTVTAYNSLGCPSKATFSVDIRTPPSPTINPPAIFCAGQPITLTASATGTNPPFAYNWSTGQTGTSITLNPGPSTDSTITVMVSNGCIGTASTTADPDFPFVAVCCSRIITINSDTTILVASGNSIKYSWQESPDKGTITCLDPRCDSVMVVAPVTTSYTVTGTDTFGCQSEQIAIVTVDVPCFQVIVPNVITPSQPGPLGLNSMLYIKTENMDAWDIHIYDRWGKEVFTTTNQYQYWTGTTESGGKAPDGVYYYVIDATCQNTSYKQDGFVQLIR